ncbi:phosphoglycolate phosphatase [Halorhodospira abdelmalekii]|uniref:phosphoglycolate phosphatase n=1 Tax=Halorhodospira abdelmalekii TaxID=421629 RepID=UPI001F5B866F|nr:phosphoglycolate phosphatase [Halorhodospira abdelmalekii]
MLKTRPHAVLFDLDGTLVDSAPDLAAAVNAVLRERGAATVDVERVRGWVGNGARRLIARALTGEESADPPAAEWNAALERFFTLYSERLYVDSRPYPGVVEGVAALHALGLPLAVVTNKPRRFAEPILTHMGLREQIAVVVGGECVAARKPDPLPLHWALEQLGLPGAPAWMVGDSATDVAAARAAGMPVICVPYGYRRGVAVEQLGADAVIGRLTELTTLLREAA